MTTVRHFTATGFVVDSGRLLLHWHPKVKAWLPPGGHIEENEDPAEAVLREIREEAGVGAEIVPTGATFALGYPLSYPRCVVPPFTIMIEDIHDPVDGYHQHIDMIYFCRLVGEGHRLNDGWRWVAAADLAGAIPMPGGSADAVPPPEDVRLLARHAFEAVGSAAR